MKPIHRVTTTIRAIQPAGDGVKLFTLADPDDWPLPAFTAGAHVDVHLPSGKVRQYSLAGEPAAGNRYLIAVREEEDGRGGSREMHALMPGDTLLVSLPRNHFPLADAPRHAMVAGGIGVTPFLSMLPVLERLGAKWELHACAANRDALPCPDLLAPYVKDGRIRFHFSDEGSRLSLPALVSGLGSDDHLYCCGPARMIDEAVELGAALGERLHVERFGFDPGTGDAAYELVLAKSGRVIPVPQGDTMLNALRVAGLDVPSSCEGGVCLECKTRYLEGTPVHRDLIMPAAERGSYVTPCVSGCASERLTLDL